MEYHVASAHVDLLTCPMRSARFFDRAQKRNHVDKMHPGCGCTQCSASFSSEEERDVHADTVHGAFPCWKCAMRFATAGALKTHCVGFHPSGKIDMAEIVSCRDKKCMRMFCTHAAMRTHFDTEHSGDTVKCRRCAVDARARGSGDRRLRQAVIFTKEELISHFEDMHTGWTPCLLCGKAFSTREEVVEHLQYSHGLLDRKLRKRFEPKPGASTQPTDVLTPNALGSLDAVPRRTEKTVRGPDSPETVPGQSQQPWIQYPQAGCWLKFRIQPMLQEHVGAVHGAFTCQHYARLFKGEEDLNAHWKTITALPKATTDPKQQVQCTECTKTFRREVGLKDHFKQKHAQFTCAGCSQKFGTEKSLLVHRRRAHPLYPCSQCGKEFGSLSEREIHTTDSHTLFTCGNCPRSFKTQHALKSHWESKHSPRRQPGRNVACTYCHKMFPTEDTRAVHIHNVHRIYFCEQCSQAFPTDGALHEHSEVAHGSYFCTRCTRSFMSEGAVGAHIKAMHGSRQG